jgi:hypothetical protein
MGSSRCFETSTTYRPVPQRNIPDEPRTQGLKRLIKRFQTIRVTLHKHSKTLRGSQRLSEANFYVGRRHKDVSANSAAIFH